MRAGLRASILCELVSHRLFSVPCASFTPVDTRFYPQPFEKSQSPATSPDKLEADAQRAGEEARRRVLDGRELALLGDPEDAVGQVLDVELESEAAPLAAEQFDAEVEVRQEVLGQSNQALFAVFVAESRGRAAAVLESAGGEEAGAAFAPGEAADGCVNLVEGRGGARAGGRVFDGEAAGGGRGLEGALRRVAEVAGESEPLDLGELRGELQAVCLAAREGRRQEEADVGEFGVLEGVAVGAPVGRQAQGELVIQSAARAGLEVVAEGGAGRLVVKAEARGEQEVLNRRRREEAVVGEVQDGAPAVERVGEVNARAEGVGALDKNVLVVAQAEVGAEVFRDAKAVLKYAL